MSLPRVASFPLGAPVPIRLRIVTKTKVMKYADIEALTSKGKEIFPAPPSNPSLVSLRLDKLVWLKASIARYSGVIDGANLIPRNSQFDVFEPEWVATTEKKRRAAGSTAKGGRAQNHNCVQFGSNFQHSYHQVPSMLSKYC